MTAQSSDSGEGRPFGPWRELRRFRRLGDAQRRVVFYAEAAADWGNLGPIARILRDRGVRGLCYVSSDSADRAMRAGEAGIEFFHIGRGTSRTILFAGLRASILMSAMPDIGGFHLLRSPLTPHYVYVFRSLVGALMTYRRGAFDHFDSILCSGPHHLADLRAADEYYATAPKRLVEHGYGLLDDLSRLRETTRRGSARTVLVAPSWGAGGLFETCGAEVVGGLLDAGFRVIARPHPMSWRKAQESLNDLARRFANRPGFEMSHGFSGFDAFAEADLMVSDWSGAALEFAFGLERPVLHVDTPRKVINPHYAAINGEPLEVTIRGDLGALLGLDRLSAIGPEAHRLIDGHAALVPRLREARARWVFNPGRSAEVAADHISAVLTALDNGENE
jgi:hypothetical protein